MLDPKSRAPTRVVLTLRIRRSYRAQFYETRGKIIDPDHKLIQLNPPKNVQALPQEGKIKANKKISNSISDDTCNKKEKGNDLTLKLQQRRENKIHREKSISVNRQPTVTVKITISNSSLEVRRTSITDSGGCKKKRNRNENRKKRNTGWWQQIDREGNAENSRPEVSNASRPGSPQH